MVYVVNPPLAVARVQKYMFHPSVITGIKDYGPSIGLRFESTMDYVATLAVVVRALLRKVFDGRVARHNASCMVATASQHAFTQI